jgi:hypothetical protein
MATAAVLFASGRRLLLALVAHGRQLTKPTQGGWADSFDKNEIVERTERAVCRAIGDDASREHVADARQSRQLGRIRSVDVYFARRDERRGDDDHAGHVDWACPGRFRIPLPRPQQDDAADEEPDAHEENEPPLLLVRHGTSMATRSLSYLLLSEKTSSLRANLEC